MDVLNVGSRLRRLRKLSGLTQHQLAARPHFSVSLLKKVEQGTVPASAAFVAGAARALGVTPAHLWGTDDSEVLEQPSEESTGITELRAALDAYDDPRPEGAPMSLTSLVDRLGALGQSWYRLRYAQVVRALPGLLHQAYLLAERPGTDGERARAALHDAYRMAAGIAGQFRQPDLAALAAERHIQLAPRTGDPLRIAISAYHRSTRHLQHGDYRAGLRMLDRAREHIGSASADRAMTVQLGLRCAVLAARAGDGRQADDYLAEARAVSEQFAPPERPYYNIDASPLNITVHWCARPVENDDGAEAVRRAAQAEVADPRRPERIGHHHIDMARAWLLHGDRGRVLEHLDVARRVAPHNTRHHPAVRETVLALAETDRRATGSLTGFARWAGISL